MFLGKTVATLELRRHNARRVDAAGTVLLQMFLGVSMGLLGRHPSPLHQLRQLHSLHPNGTAHLRRTSATGTTPRKTILTGIGSLAIHHQLELVQLLITQLVVKKVRTEIVY